MQRAPTFLDLFATSLLEKRPRSITRQISFANPLKSRALPHKIKRPVCARSVSKLARVWPRRSARTPLHFFVVDLKCAGVTHHKRRTHFALIVTHRSRANRFSPLRIGFHSTYTQVWKSLWITWGKLGFSHEISA